MHFICLIDFIDSKNPLDIDFSLWIWKNELMHDMTGSVWEHFNQHNKFFKGLSWFYEPNIPESYKIST